MLETFPVNAGTVPSMVNIGKVVEAKFKHTYENGSILPILASRLPIFPKYYQAIRVLSQTKFTTYSSKYLIHFK